MRQHRERLFPEGTLFKVEPQPNGTKVRTASDPQSGETLDQTTMPEHRLRTKAIKRRRRAY